MTSGSPATTRGDAEGGEGWYGGFGLATMRSAGRDRRGAPAAGFLTDEESDAMVAELRAMGVRAEAVDRART